MGKSYCLKMIGVVLGVLVLSVSSVQAGMTFLWSMENETPDVYPAGSDSTPGYGHLGQSLRSTDEAYRGNYSMDLSGGAWKSAVFDNPTENHVWASPQEGAVVVWFKYTGQFSGGMLWQITGKAQGLPIDTNDGVSVRFKDDHRLRMGFGWSGGDSWQTTYIQYDNVQPFVANQWYKVTAKWQTGDTPHLSLQVDDNTPVTGGLNPSPTTCIAWHQVLIGNDLNLAPEGLYLDDFTIYNDYAMTPEPGGLAILLIGVTALMGRRKSSWKMDVE